MDHLPVILLLLLIAALGLLPWLLGRRCLAASETDWGRGWVNCIDGCIRLFCRRWHRLQPVHLAIPPTGPAILVSNHISGLDPFVMVACSHRPLRFLIAREWYRLPGLHWLFKAVGCIPVDRQGSPEKALRAAFRSLQEGEVVALFPHGKIHLDSEPPRRLKAGAARLASYTGAPLIPMRITGVRRQGHVLSSLLLRSRVEITPYAPIDPAGQSSEALLQRLQGLLEP